MSFIFNCSVIFHRDHAFQDVYIIVLFPPPWLSSLEIETAVVDDNTVPDLEVVW